LEISFRKSLEFTIHNALVPFAERRKINMKKRKNLGKKLVTMLVSVGFFAVLITVLNLMALQAIRGKNNVLTLAGKDLYRMKEDALAVFRRRKIGFVFQAFNLVSSVNVWENIVLPLGLDGRKVDEAYVNDIIATLGIENRIYNLPNQLSGGQQQRVAIARALVNRPEIIFADEPTGNLDSKTSDEVIALLKMTAKKYGQTIVMITHDDEIAQVADRILVIEDGQVVDFR